MDLGSGGGTSSTGVGSGSGAADAGVADLCGGVVFLLFAACSARAAARAGSFLFFSIQAASRSGCASLATSVIDSWASTRMCWSVPIAGIVGGQEDSENDREQERCWLLRKGGGACRERGRRVGRVRPRPCCKVASGWEEWTRPRKEYGSSAVGSDALTQACETLGQMPLIGR